MINWQILRYDRIGSTNDEAVRLAQAGAADGTVVRAREQTAGRGRQARQWHSPVGNLYVSLLLRPHVTPARAAELSFVTALAVADTVDRFLPDGVTAELKWPNDVLVRGAKISGILIESVEAAVIVGIGLNVAHTPAAIPYRVTSLAASGAGPANVDAVLEGLLHSFAQRFEDWHAGGFTTTRAAWLARAYRIGSAISVTIGGTTTTGTFVELATDGALVVQTAEGVRHFVAGDVVA